MLRTTTWGRAMLGAALALFALAAAIASCADDAVQGGGDVDGGEAGVVVAVGVCPEAAPEGGTGCIFPEGTTCAFGACGPPIAVCTRGVWRYATNPEPSPTCPKDEPPNADSPCPPCWPATVTCEYGRCDGPDASPNRATASCPSGTWTIAVTACGDAGADVQGDSGTDAD